MITLFNCLKKLGTKIIVDFEAAVRNAIKKMQPDAEINRVCFFYLGQAVWHKVQKTVFTSKYIGVDEFRLNFKNWFAWRSFALTI